jgi:hypothetical protein
MCGCAVITTRRDVARFADRNRFASRAGTAPLDASSGEQIRHRLSRAGNRRMNHMLHIGAISQIRLDTAGRAYYRRRRAGGKTPLEAPRCLQRRISDAVYRQLVADARRAHPAILEAGHQTGARERTAGRLINSARSTCPRPSTLRISHFPDPQPRRYPPARIVCTPSRLGCSPPAPAHTPGAESAALTTEGSRSDAQGGATGAVSPHNLGRNRHADRADDTDSGHHQNYGFKRQVGVSG